MNPLSNNSEIIDLVLELERDYPSTGGSINWSSGTAQLELQLFYDPFPDAVEFKVKMEMVDKWTQVRG